MIRNGVVGPGGGLGGALSEDLDPPCSERQAHARRSFQLAGISEDGERWSAGANTRFVQTGDVVDRGERSIEIVQIIANMQREAATRVNSSVTALLGNHELLTLQGDYRYVAREELLRLGKASLESKNLGGQEMGTGYGLRAYWAY